MSNPGFPEPDAALTHILVVSDVERAKSFYSHVLGANLYREYEGPSAVYDFLGNWLLIVSGGPPTPDKPATTFAPPHDPNQVSSAFTIRVSDCEAVYEALRERGAEFLTPPHESAGGREIRCFFRDPDGHLFEISQVT